MLYGTKQIHPILGKARVQLECEEGKRIFTTAYLVAGQEENLLRARDAVALGIITIDMNHTFHQFRHAYGLFRFNRLVMGAYAASAECHAKAKYWKGCQEFCRSRTTLNMTRSC